jgi:hypothetical protein
MSENTQPKEEKKSFKELLLDKVNEKYGLYHAAVMEDAFSLQKSKQLDPAMSEQGMSLPQIAQSIGIDYNKLFGDQLKPPEQPTMPKAGGLFGMLGGRNPEAAQTELQNQLLLQKLMGGGGANTQKIAQNIEAAKKIAPAGYEPIPEADGTITFKPKPQGVNELAMSLKESQQQDRLENNAIQRLSSIRGDVSIARVENQRDAAITAYRRISELEAQGEQGLNPVDYTDILGQLYRARTGVAPTEQILKDIRQNTIPGKLGKAYTFVTGEQAPTSTKDITDSLKKMAESFGKQADKLHEGYMKTHLIKPKGLDDDRWQNIVQNQRGMSFDEATSEYRNTATQTQKSSLPPDKAKRLQELREKKAKGTLGR